MSKKRSEQQQIDDQALKILRNRFPNDFIFREQEKDFGIDCELEYFQNDETENGLVGTSTGIIFKAQVKGVKFGSKLELTDTPALSKQLKLSDLHYWYKQITIPVVILLVDIESETVYWTDYYSNIKLRNDFASAVQNNKDSINVHFPKDQTIPETIEQLLAAVSNANQRIALGILPDYTSIINHLRETQNIDLDIKIIEEKLELAQYERLSKNLEKDDLGAAEDNIKEIIGNSGISLKTKLHTIFSSGRVLMHSDLDEELGMDKFSAILTWQLNALQDCAKSTNETDPLFSYTTDILEHITKISLIARDIFNQGLKADSYSSLSSNFFAQFSASIYPALESSAFLSLRELFLDLNKTINEQEDYNIQIRAMGFTSPMLVQALVPLKLLFMLKKEQDKAQFLVDYSIDLLRTHASICELTLDRYLLNQNLTSLLSMLFIANSQTDLSPAEEIISSIVNPDFREEAQAIFNDLIELSQQHFKPQDMPDDIELIKNHALMLANLEGYDLEKRSDEVGYKDKLHNDIHDILKKGIDELDLTEYLKDCIHRHIYLPGFSGISPLAESFGLGFASARKGVICIKKEVFNTMLSYYLRDTYKSFYDENCKNCQEKEPHNAEWKYSYSWQVERDKLSNEIFAKLKKDIQNDQTKLY